MKKIIAVFIFLLIAAFPIYFILAHDVAVVPSDEDSDTIGAYYDETWEVIRFLYTREGPERPADPALGVHRARQLEYERGDEDDMLADLDAAVVREEPRIGTGGAALPGATLAQEFLVIEWKSTGHLHFTE